MVPDVCAAPSSSSSRSSSSLSTDSQVSKGSVSARRSPKSWSILPPRTLEPWTKPRNLASTAASPCPRLMLAFRSPVREVSHLGGLIREQVRPLAIEVDECSSQLSVRRRKVSGATDDLGDDWRAVGGHRGLFLTSLIDVPWCRPVSHGDKNVDAEITLGGPDALERLFQLYIRLETTVSTSSPLMADHSTLDTSSLPPTPFRRLRLTFQ